MPTSSPAASTSPEREEKLKLTNPDIAVEKAANEEVFRPEGYDYLELDVTRLEPAESAAQILAELERRTNNTNTNREKGK
jgi:hypothetical protein